MDSEEQGPIDAPEVCDMSDYWNGKSAPRLLTDAELSDMRREQTERDRRQLMAWAWSVAPLLAVAALITFIAITV
jgi:hypothetical protein